MSAIENLISLNAEEEWTIDELEDSLRSMGIEPTEILKKVPITDEYKAANQILPEDAQRIAAGLALGWTAPSRNTFSGRLAGHPPERLTIDVWPELDEMKND